MHKKIHCLSKNEIKVYEAGLKIGGATILQLFRQSGVNRTTTYNIVENLIKKGLMTIAFKGKKRYFYPTEPNKVLDLANKQIKLASQDRLAIEKIIPSWQEIYYATKIRPKIRFYEGIESIKEIYEDTLRQDKGGEILALVSAEALNKYLPGYIDKYIRRRFRKKIEVRGFIIDTPQGRKHYKKYKDYLLEVKFIKPPVPFSTEINLYNNKVALISYGEELVGTIIESKEIYNTQKTIIELLWQSIK